MTTTKAAYFIAVFVPFGCVALAVIALAHWYLQRRATHNAAPAPAAI